MSQACLHILNGERGLDTYPSVYNSMFVLANQGWFNYIATAGDIEGFAGQMTKVYPLRGGYLRRAWQIANIAEKFDMVVVYEPRDVEIFYLSKILGSRIRPSVIVHHCLEVPTAMLRQRGIRQAAHRILYKGYQEINWILIQDQSRKRLFQDSVPGVQKSVYALIPNSYIVEIEPLAPALPWFDELRRASRWLVTYTGAVERWAIAPEFMTAIRDMKHISFLFSGWSHDGLADQLMNDFKGASHIHFEMGKKSRGELNHIVSRSDMGMIFYDSADPNVAEVGLSSGKLHKFLSYNKPVLSNCLPALEHFLRENGFGLSAAPSSMGIAIDTILGSLDEYSSRIRERYSKMCDFRRAYQSFLDQVHV